MKLFNNVVSAYYTTKSRAADFIRKQDGVTALEYAIVAAGVASVVLVVFSSDGSFGSSIKGVFSSLSSKLTTLMASGSGTAGGATS